MIAAAAFVLAFVALFGWWRECLRRDAERACTQHAMDQADLWALRAHRAADRLAERVAADIARRPAHDERGRFTRKT